MLGFEFANPWFVLPPVALVIGFVYVLGAIIGLVVLYRK